MPILNFEQAPQRRKSLRGKSAKRMIFAALGLATMVGIGTTLAGQIFIGTTPSGDVVTFGQGVAQTVSCDSSINLAPRSDFDSLSGNFKFDAITISGVDQACSGKMFVLKAYGSASELQFPSDPYGNAFRFYFDSTGWYGIDDSCMTISSGIFDSPDANGLTIDWSECIHSSYTANSSDVQRLTLEATENPYAVTHS